jgi:hypothetical protein
MLGNGEWGLENGETLRLTQQNRAASGGGKIRWGSSSRTPPPARNCSGNQSRCPRAPMRVLRPGYLATVTMSSTGTHPGLPGRLACLLSWRMLSVSNVDCCSLVCRFLSAAAASNLLSNPWSYTRSAEPCVQPVCFVAAGEPSILGLFDLSIVWSENSISSADLHMSRTTAPSLRLISIAQPALFRHGSPRSCSCHYRYP